MVTRNRSNQWARTGCVSLVLAIVPWGLGTLAQGPSDLPAPLGKVSNRHRLVSADDPPGAIGAIKMRQLGIAGYFQPVELRGPGGTAFSLAIDGVFQTPSEAGCPLKVGLHVGGVYRFKVTSIPGFEGEELFPTLELIDRTYPPHHLAACYPIPIELELDDLRAALSGNLVTRVIYLEDRVSALPIDKPAGVPLTLDVPAHQDPLEVADTMGRPVAILRIGSVLPPQHQVLLHDFFFGFPPWVCLPSSPIEPHTTEGLGDRGTLDPGIVPVGPGQPIPDDKNVPQTVDPEQGIPPITER